MTMSVTGMTTPHCGYCGRPVIGAAIYAGGLAYNPECTRGPSAQQTYQLPPLTEEMVRKIVREELARMTTDAEFGGVPARTKSQNSNPVEDRSWKPRTR